jgi:ribosomal protein S18 acetylase RimI-like enzyme
VSAQTIERLGERARLATWRGDGRVAHLAPTATRPLSAGFVSDCLGWLRDRGYQSVVTSALSPPECRGFLQTGFDVQEELDLLSHDLRGVAPWPRPRARAVRRARHRDRPAVIEVDALAFQPFWRLHQGGLDEALAATPTVRFRVAAPRRGTVSGYAITGRGGDTGYLQRLAVHPAARGQGMGRTLVVDALAWLRRGGATQAMVNTQRTNDHAHALYEACGFRLLPEGLSVLARDL